MRICSLWTLKRQVQALLQKSCNMFYFASMTDKLTEEKRSWNMSRIKGKDTKPELLVRSYLHKKGFRFTLHNSKLPGKPDICLPKYKTVIFVHGCFWHRHKGCKFATTPKSKIEFWKDKFEKNIIRDRKNTNLLKNLKWRVIVIWECEITNETKLKKKLLTYI
jgi:DNA mismatch endonuclease, patch repair protein